MHYFNKIVVCKCGNRVPGRTLCEQAFPLLRFGVANATKMVKYVGVDALTSGYFHGLFRAFASAHA